LLWLGLSAIGCGGTTGGNLITLPFQAGGDARDATRPFVITADQAQGWTVRLDQALVVLGPLYFNVDSTNTFRSGVVIVQVTRQFIVDMLDPTLQDVSGGANGETGQAVSAEIDFYTTAESYNDMGLDGGLGAPLAADGQQGTAYLAGQATKNGAVIDFAGRVQITSALISPLTPIDFLSTVSGVQSPLNFTKTSGALQLRVDPSHWFGQANFCSLVSPPPVRSGDGGTIVAVADGAVTAGVTMDGGVIDGGAIDAGASAGGKPTVAPCTPLPGKIYGWADTNPFNSQVLSGMRANVGVYQFSLAAP
jgi:hypothetical protein